MVYFYFKAIILIILVSTVHSTLECATAMNNEFCALVVRRVEEDLQLVSLPQKWIETLSTDYKKDKTRELCRSYEADMMICACGWSRCDKDPSILARVKLKLSMEKDVDFSDPIIRKTIQAYDRWLAPLLLRELESRQKLFGYQPELSPNPNDAESFVTIQELREYVNYGRGNHGGIRHIIRRDIDSVTETTAHTTENQPKDLSDSQPSSKMINTTEAAATFYTGLNISVVAGDTTSLGDANKMSGSHANQERMTSVKSEPNSTRTVKGGATAAPPRLLTTTKKNVLQPDDTENTKRANASHPKLQASASKSDNDEGFFSLPIIIMGVIAGLILILVVAFFVWFLMNSKKRRRRRSITGSSDSTMTLSTV